MLLVVRLYRALLVLSAAVVALLMLVLLALGRHPHDLRYIHAFAAHHRSPTDATGEELAAATTAHYWGFFWRELVLAAILAVLLAAIWRTREGHGRG